MSSVLGYVPAEPVEPTPSLASLDTRGEDEKAPSMHVCRGRSRLEASQMDEDGNDLASQSGDSIAAPESEGDDGDSSLGELAVDEQFQGCCSQLAQALLQPLPQKASLCACYHMPLPLHHVQVHIACCPVDKLAQRHCARGLSLLLHAGLVKFATGHCSIKGQSAA